MFFYEWLVPAIGILAATAWIFYMAVKNKTGAGVRTDGRCVVDKPVAEDDNPPA